MDVSEAGSLQPAELVAERICHDLAGLAGTLSGALDMALDEHERPCEALSLASEIALSLNARLRLLRAAFGGGCGELTAAGIAELTPGLPGAERLTIICDALEGSLDEIYARALWLLLLLAATAMPRGGRIEIAGRQGALAVRATAKACTWPAGLQTPVAAPLTPRAFPNWLLHYHLATHKITIFTEEAMVWLRDG